MSFIKTIHNEPYPAISPSRPELSQAGQAVLVTGAQGIGFYISKAFAQAGAATIVIASRNIKTVEWAIDSIKKDVPNYRGRLVGKECDVGDAASTEELWATLDKENIIVDVLVLNVARSDGKGPLVDTELGLIWNEFRLNILSHIDFAQRFVKQNRAKPNGHKKVMLDISSTVIHDFKATGGMPNYSLTKNASTLAIQQIAKDVDSGEVQIISFHPGAIFTDAARRAIGVQNKSDVPFPFDSEDLPGAFSVWASSDEAKFLHGRFVWAAWDVEEMMQGEVADRIKKDLEFLKVGVGGLKHGTLVAV